MRFRRAAKKFANLILKRLRELGWSQNDLAEKMEVRPRLVNQWVKGLIR
ncbi:helix-turn-helix domain-containing protein [Arachidicoccus ginsenosidivorans]